MDADDKHHDETAEEPGRRRARWLFLAFLIVQLVVPLTYYLRSDPYDERFAWRMFSNVRLHGCRTAVSERVRDGERVDARQINLHRTLEVRWSRLLSRNRVDVIEGFLEWRCLEEERVEVTLVNTCTTPAGEALTPQRYSRDCESRETTLPDAPLIPMTPPEASP